MQKRQFQLTAPGRAPIKPISQLTTLQNQVASLKSIVRKIGGRLPQASPNHSGRLGKNAMALHREGFQGLEEDMLYYDPAGFSFPGGVNGRVDMLEETMPAIKAFDMIRRRGGNFDMAVQAYRQISMDQALAQTKTLVSSSWNIPIHAIPDVRVVSPGQLPLATLIPRVAINKDQVQATPATGIGAAAPIGETDATYTINDDVYHDGTVADYTFTVKGYGRANNVSELMTLVGGNIKNPRQNNALLQLLAVRRLEEVAIFQGTHTGTGYSGNAGYFQGLYDFSQKTGNAIDEDKSGGIDYPDDLREMFNLLVSYGANRDTMMAVTDAVTFTNIANALQTYVRTGSPYRNFEVRGNGADLDVTCVVIDKVCIFPSYGAPTAANKKEILAFDASTVYMAMVQDAMLKPLAKTGPFEHAATDAFGCLVSEGFKHVGRYHTIA